MSRRVPKWAFFPITDKKGLRLYARLRSDDYIKQKVCIPRIPSILVTINFNLAFHFNSKMAMTNIGERTKS